MASPQQGQQSTCSQSRLNKEYVKVRSSSSTDWRWVLSISWKWKQWLVIKNIFNPLFFVGMGRGCWWMEYWAGKCTLGILSMSHEGYILEFVEISLLVRINFLTFKLVVNTFMFYPTWELLYITMILY